MAARAARSSSRAVIPRSCRFRSKAAVEGGRSPLIPSGLAGRAWVVGLDRLSIPIIFVVRWKCAQVAVAVMARHHAPAPCPPLVICKHGAKGNPTRDGGPQGDQTMIAANLEATARKFVIEAVPVI